MCSLEVHWHFSHVSNSSSWQDAVKHWMFHYCLKTFWDIKMSFLQSILNCEILQNLKCQVKCLFCLSMLLCFSMVSSTWEYQRQNRCQLRRIETTNRRPKQRIVQYTNILHQVTQSCIGTVCDQRVAQICAPVVYFLFIKLDSHFSNNTSKVQYWHR